MKRPTRALVLAIVVGAWLLNATGVAADVAAPPIAAPVTDVHVRAGGSHMLVRYGTDGSTLQRFTGFGQISGLAVYDETTVLVAEEDRDTISAMTLDGSIVWSITVHRPRCISVIGPDRFLVCQDDPAGVLETDRAGNVLWKITSPLVDAAGAVRLADGNTAVVEGRENHHAVHVFTPDGKIVWSGTKMLAQPRGLALLPSGELVTSGFDSGQIVFFQPYTDAVQSFGFCCHAESPSVAPDGTVINVTGEQQIVQASDAQGVSLWHFRTFYPPTRTQMLADGSVLVSVFRVPDRQCMNAALAAQRARRPIAPYWRWLGIGIGAALLLTLLVQSPVLWHNRRARPATAPSECGEPQDAEQPAPMLSRLRRFEIGVYVLGAIGVAAAAAEYHRRILALNNFQGWPDYAALIGVAGVFLALLQYRMPDVPRSWTWRMDHLEAMEVPTWRMWLLWIVGVALLIAGLEGVLRQRGDWALVPWSAGLVLIAGGTIQKRAPRMRARRGAVLAALAALGVLAFVRLYRLEDYPPNLHLDMAQWSVAVFRLLDGDPRTMFEHGFAEIPLLGHVWSALFTGIAGRSLMGTRLSSVVGSLVAIAAAFVLTRRMYGTWSAVVVALVLGTNHGFLHFSRIQHYMDPIPFHVLGVLGLVAGLETGRYGWFALGGVAGGYSALTYHAGRITPPVIALLAALLLVRYRRAVLKRWPGLLLFGVLLLGVLGPQAILYRTGRLNAFGRSEVYPFMRNGHADPQLLLQTLAQGVPRVIGAFWYYGDTSTQYGGGWPIFFPACAALLGMAVVAAVLRPRDIRGPWVVLWTFVVLFVGGALTIDPPFWPRFVTAFVPATIAAAAVVGWLCRGAEVAAGRVGRGIAIVATCALVGFTAWQQLGAYRDYCVGVRPGQTTPSLTTEWVQSIMGRDIQRWGSTAKMYLVALNPNWHSCQHPTMEFYADAVDLQDARDISQYLPFQDPRTIVCYVLPDMTEYIATVKRFYPSAEEKVFYTNLGQAAFTRLVIRAPHS